MVVRNTQPSCASLAVGSLLSAAPAEEHELADEHDAAEEHAPEEIPLGDDAPDEQEDPEEPAGAMGMNIWLLPMIRPPTRNA
jgi:hypothetical protein